jgi:hypothetical protein
MLPVEANYSGNARWRRAASSRSDTDTGAHAWNMSCTRPVGAYWRIAMNKSHWESFKAEGQELIDRIKALIRKGNVRRVVIEHQGRSVAEFPLTAGVVGAVLAPQVAAIAAVVAVFKDCTIRVEQAPGASGDAAPQATGTEGQ